MRSFAFFFARRRHYFLFLQLQDCQTWNSWCSVSKTFVTCYYITNIPCVAYMYFYCCQNCMDLNYKPQFALLLALVFCLFNWDNLLIQHSEVINKKKTVNLSFETFLAFLSKKIKTARQLVKKMRLRDTILLQTEATRLMKFDKRFARPMVFLASNICNLLLYNYS